MTIEDYKKQVEELRASILFEMEDADTPTPRCEQDILMAVSYLQLAACALQMADYHRMHKQ